VPECGVRKELALAELRRSCPLVPRFPGQHQIYLCPLHLNFAATKQANSFSLCWWKCLFCKCMPTYTNTEFSRTTNLSTSIWHWSKTRQSAPKYRTFVCELTFKLCSRSSKCFWSTGTLDWVENSLLSSQHLGNGKSPNGWHNFEASFLLSLTMELLLSQEQALTKDVIKKKGFSHVALRIGPHWNWFVCSRITSVGFSLCSLAKTNSSLLQVSRSRLLAPVSERRSGLHFYKHFSFKRYCKRKLELNNGYSRPSIDNLEKIFIFGFVVLPYYPLLDLAALFSSNSGVPQYHQTSNFLFQRPFLQHSPFSF